MGEAANASICPTSVIEQTSRVDGDKRAAGIVSNAGGVAAAGVGGGATGGFADVTHVCWLNGLLV